MRIFGKTNVGATTTTVQADTKRVSRYHCLESCFVPKLSMYLDGLGGGDGTALLKAVVYDTDGNLIAVGDEVQILSGSQPGWVDLGFSTPGGVPFEVADYDMGFLAGGETNIVRSYADPEDVGGKFNSDTYSDGPADPFGSATASDGRLSLFATFIKTWVPTANATDLYYARLPFAESQSVFSAGGPLKTPVFRADVGWYGDAVDSEHGAFCLVNQGSEFEQLIGERIKITRADRFNGGTIYCFVHNRYGLVDDLAVTRRMFLALGYPAADNFPCTIEVMQ
jgi:hypothetical protein